MDFNIIRTAVAVQFQLMSGHTLYRTAVDKDKLWETYLGSFPEGTNPIYRTRTEHDCSADRSFVRTLGGVVAVVNGKLATIWDNMDALDGPYGVVCAHMAELVRASAIDTIFLHSEKHVGVKVAREMLEDGTVKNWYNLYVDLPASAVAHGDQIGTREGDARSTKDVFLRGMQEITLDAIDTTLDLIAQGSLYRGDDLGAQLPAYRKLKVLFDKVKPVDRDAFAWANSVVPAARLRNTAIGTLLQDLSEGKELEYSVKSFETKVAPTNYKRPTALVTAAMIKKAQQTIADLGFTSALERRYAVPGDITINNVLFADRSARRAMNVFDELAAAAPTKTQQLDKVEEVSIEDFLSKIVPKAESMEVMFENSHLPNLVSLIAPVDPDAKHMFKWDNNFSWSYTGEVTDSIKERVKAAGGSVTGDLCCRLAWDYTDDLDFHMGEPGNFKIYFGNKRQLSANGGMLDVDANGGDGLRDNPVENIYYANKMRMKDGVYKLSVNNYSRRSDGKGFEVEVEFGGEVHSFVYDKALRTGQTIHVADITYSKREGFKVRPADAVQSSTRSKEVWNINTMTFQKVSMLMLSPNQWNDRPVGNKHYFFMLEDCRNDGKARGFFNEFLTTELDQHRKVFEVVGAKMKTDESDSQLSGLGFSSTQRNHLLVRVKGSFTRTVKVTF